MHKGGIGPKAEAAVSSPVPSALYANGLALTQSLSHAPGQPKQANSTARCSKARAHAPAHTRAGPGAADTTNYCAAVGGALDARLKVLQELRRKAEAAIPLAPSALNMALQMPGVLKCFRFIAGRKRQYELRRSFSLWYNREIVHYHQLVADVRNISVIELQRRWRGYRTRLALWRCKEREAKRMVTAVGVVHRLCRVYKLRKAVRLRIEEKQRAAVYPTAVLIQSAVRLMLGRWAYLREAKRVLYGELRLWSGGRVDRLLRRPGIGTRWCLRYIGIMKY